MFSRACASILFLLIFTTLARTERPIQPKDDASLVVTGTVGKITTTKAKFGNDGVMTNYSATVKVDKVERGTDVKPGETIKVLWFHVTKRPSQPLFGAYGQSYKLKGKTKAKFWLVKESGDGWTIIYNPKGVEKAKKSKK